MNFRVLRLLGRALSVICILGFAGCGSDTAVAPDASGNAGGATAPAASKPAPPPTEITVDIKTNGAKGVKDAIGKIAAKGTIKVKPGTYSAWIARKDVTIIGEGKPEEIIFEATHRQPGDVADGECRVSNVTFHCKGEKFAGMLVNKGKLITENCIFKSDLGSGLAVLGGAAEATKCVFQDCRDNGVCVTGGAAVIADCLFTGCKSGANCFVGANGNATVRKCVIKDGKDCGVLLEVTRNSIIEDNEITGNQNGIIVARDAAGTIRKNKIHKNKDNGVFVTLNATPQIVENEIYDQSFACVEIKQNGNPTIKGNILRDSDLGVMSSMGGKGTIEENTISKTRIGVCISDSSTATLKKNKISASTMNHCNVTGSSTATLEENDFSASGDAAIAFNKSRGTLKANKIHDNAMVGVFITVGSDVMLENNDIFNNRLAGVRVDSGCQGRLINNRINRNEGGIEMRYTASVEASENDLLHNKLGSYLFDPDKNKTLKRSKNVEEVNPLSRAKLGDWVEYKNNSFGTLAVERRVIQSRSDDVITAEITQVVGKEGKKQVMPMSIFSRIEFASLFTLSAPGVSVKEVGMGEEKLTLGKTTLNTTWKELELNGTRPDGQPVKGKIKVWTSAEVPFDNTVKVDAEFPQGQMQVELLAFGDAATLPKTPPALPAGASKLVGAKKEDPKLAAALKTYVLKDGRKISASTAIDAGNEISIKDENGKFVVVKKSDIEEIIEPKK